MRAIAQKTPCIAESAPTSIRGTGPWQVLTTALTYTLAAPAATPTRTRTSIQTVQVAPKILFLMFSTVLVLASLRVITARNPVHSALSLVLAFFSSACLWMLLQAEFLAIVLVLVYVGAVMVLFLFVVMMLDINIEPLREGFTRYLPVGVVVALLIVAQLAPCSALAASASMMRVGADGRRGARRQQQRGARAAALHGVRVCLSRWRPSCCSWPSSPP